MLFRLIGSELELNELLQTGVGGRAGSGHGPSATLFGGRPGVVGVLAKYPVESAFDFGTGPGWPAALPGEQRIRLVFHQPQSNPTHAPPSSMNSKSRDPPA
jgi:hypothetical protein